MDLRYKFNEDAANYDKWRPAYCTELFNDILSSAQLNPGKSVIEIGIGTGQATKPFLMTNCQLTAIELGNELTDYARHKFMDYSNLNIIHTSFEECEIRPN